MTRTRRTGVTQFSDGRLFATAFSTLPCIRCGSVEELDGNWKCALCASGGRPARPHPKPQVEPAACQCRWHMSKKPTFQAAHTARHLKRRAA